MIILVILLSPLVGGFFLFLGYWGGTGFDRSEISACASVAGGVTLFATVLFALLALAVSL